MKWFQSQHSFTCWFADILSRQGERAKHSSSLTYLKNVNKLGRLLKTAQNTVAQQTNQQMASMCMQCSLFSVNTVTNTSVHQIGVLCFYKLTWFFITIKCYYIVQQQCKMKQVCKLFTCKSHGKNMLTWIGKMCIGLLHMSAMWLDTRTALMYV